MEKIELLAPVGDFERLIVAIHYGADAVYLGGKSFGLRAYASNFDNEELKNAIIYAHSHNVKVYVTVNILAHNEDFNNLLDYLLFLESIKVDAVIVSDLGIASIIKKYTNLELHVSTQANITNKYSANVWISLEAKRLVLARELSLKEIKEIRSSIPNDISIECFGHGAMCISYSGRCLLSNFFTGRDSNKGACAQPCRWNYAISYKEYNESNEFYPIEEDNRGTYILNSKDLCTINFINDLADAGINSLKIEGRMKSSYYVATVVNAYRRAIDDYYSSNSPSFNYIEELNKTSNREFTDGFYFNSNQKTNNKTSSLNQTYTYIALVLSSDKESYIFVEHRNKFKVGDTLEILSPSSSFNKEFKIEEILDINNNKLVEVKKIKERVYIKCPYKLNEYDILRKKKEENE